MLYVPPEPEPFNAAESIAQMHKQLDAIHAFEIYSRLVGIFEDSRILRNAEVTQFTISLKLDGGEKPRDYLDRVKKTCSDANKVSQEKLKIEGKFNLDDSGKKIVCYAEDNAVLAKAMKLLGKSVGPALRIASAAR